jgi:hypothetical protein
MSDSEREIMKRVETLAAGIKPEPPYWLRHNDHGEDPSMPTYCENCVEALAAWLCGGEKPEHVQEEANGFDHWQMYPTGWGFENDPDDITIDGGWSQEESSVRVCNLCDCLLVTTLNDVIDLEYFEELATEQCKSMSPRNWRILYDTLDAADDMEYEVEGYRVRAFAAAAALLESCGGEA